MTVSMTGNIDRVEVITSAQRRRRWSAEEKARIVQETYAPGMSVSLVARQHGAAPNQVFTWRRLYAEGALSAIGAGEEVVPASEYRALQHQVRELQRLLGKKTLENEVLRDALDVVQPKNGCCARPRRHGTTCREDDRPYARGRSLQSGCANSFAEAAPAAWPAPSARCGACRRDQGADRRPADLRLPTHPCAAAASTLRRRRHGGQREAGLPGHEGARAAAPTPYRSR